MPKWMLAFDAGCGACSDVIDRIGAAVDGRLTVVGLGEVRELREIALGDDPVFAPTLLRVDGDRVRAWTGPSLSLRLALLLGPSRSFAVVRALNSADVVVHGSRRSLLKAAPGLALGAFLVSGGLASTAMAAPGRRMGNAEADEWAASLTRLPTSYAEVTALPVVKRRAVYRRLSEASRAGLWHEHLLRYRAARPGLTKTQAAFVDRVSATLPEIIGSDDLSKLRDEAIVTLGHAEALAAFGTLGAAEPAGVKPYPQCDCNPDFTPCTSCGRQDPYYCYRTYKGCGFLYQQDCTGMCGG